VYELATGQTSLATAATAPKEFVHWTGAGAISNSGRFVVYVTYYSTNAGREREEQIVLLDRDTGSSEVITNPIADAPRADGVHPYGYGAHVCAISDSGRFVLFASGYSDLVEDDTNDEWDVFLHDRKLGQTTRHSVRSDGSQVTRGGGCGLGFLSADASSMLLGSSARLTSGDRDSAYDAYIRYLMP
jgi:hypothetical protein